MTEFVEKLKVLTSNLTLSCDMCFEDDPLPRFDFDTFNLLKENTEQDDRFNQFARYITNRIKNILMASLSKEEQSFIKTKKVKELKQYYTDSFSFILPSKILNITSDANQPFFPAFNLVFDTEAKHKPVATAQKTAYSIDITLNVLNAEDKVNLGTLKQFFIHAYVLDHEIVHYLDYIGNRIHPTAKSFEDYDTDSCYKANAPAEWHAYSQTLISMLKDKYKAYKFNHTDIHKVIKLRDTTSFFNTLRNILSARLNFIDKLAPRTKQDLMGRLVNFILYSLRKEEAFTERYYREAFNNKNITPDDITLYFKMLYENMELNKTIVLVENNE